MIKNAFLSNSRSMYSKLSQQEEAYNRGKLEAYEEIMKLFEDNVEEDVEVVLGEIHLAHMKINNKLNCKNEQQVITGTEYYTNKYLSTRLQ